MSRIWNNFLQKKAEQICKFYVKRRNKCVSLNEKTKKEYYQNFDDKNVI